MPLARKQMTLRWVCDKRVGGMGGLVACIWVLVVYVPGPTGSALLFTTTRVAATLPQTTRVHVRSVAAHLPKNQA